MINIVNHNYDQTANLPVLWHVIINSECKIPSEITVAKHSFPPEKIKTKKKKTKKEEEEADFFIYFLFFFFSPWNKL